MSCGLNGGDASRARAWVSGGWFTALVLIAGSGTMIERTAGDGTSDAAKALLERATAAARAVKSARYEVQYASEGWLSQFVPQVTGTVTVGGQSKWKITRYACELQIQPRGAESATKLTSGCDGETFFVIDHEAKRAHEDMDPSVLGKNHRNIQRSVLSEFSSAEPYQDDRKDADSIELGEALTIDGVECQPLEFRFKNDRVTIRYVATTDGLPRRVEHRIRNPKGEMGTLTLSIRRLEVNPPVSEETFKLQLPDGFTKTDEFAE